MAWDLQDDRPIYIQIVEHIQLSILSGKYKPGEKFPSVRELAMEAAVNPNTMQKAMAELERQGLLYSHRTSGRFITEDTKMIEEMKENLAKEQVKLFFQNMQKIGYSKTETLQIVIKAAEEMK